MGKAGAARKLAAAAAYGGGGLSALGAGALRRPARRGEARPHGRSASSATSRRPMPPAGTAAAGPARPSRSRCSATPARPATAWIGSRRPPARMLAAVWPSERIDGSTCASSPSSARSPRDLADQVDRRIPIEPDVAVILIGANDVTHTVLPAQSVRHLSEAVRRLRGRRGPVVVGHLPRPGHDPADRAAAQAGRPHLVAPARRRPDHRGRRGGRPHGLARLDPRPGVRRRPDRAVRARPVPPLRRRLPLRWRPSWCRRCWPRSGLIPDDEAPPEARRGEGVLPVVAAALRAVNRPGTELDGTEVGGSARGVRGLWVELRHRRAPAGPRHRARPGRGRRGRRRRSDARRTRPGPVNRGRGGGAVLGQSWLKKARMRSRLV